MNKTVQIVDQYLSNNFRIYHKVPDNHWMPEMVLIIYTLDMRVSTLLTFNEVDFNIENLKKGISTNITHFKNISEKYPAFTPSTISKVDILYKLKEELKPLYREDKLNELLNT